MYLLAADGNVCFIVVLARNDGVFGQDKVRDVTVFRKDTYLIVKGVCIHILILNAMLFIVWTEGSWEFKPVESTHNLNLTDDLIL